MARSISRRHWLKASGAGFVMGTSRTQRPAEDDVSAVTADGWARGLTSAAPLAMRFLGNSAAECRKWQSEFSAQLRSLLGPFAPPARWRVVEQKVAVLDDHRREQLLLAAEDCPPLPVYLLLPHRLRDRRPAGMLAIHGHGAYGYHAVAGREDLPGVREAIQAANYDFGRQLVRRGYAVAVPCLTPFGPRLGSSDQYGGQDPCADTFMRLQMLGKLLIAENLRDCLWALSLLLQHNEVDSSRIGCAGLSYGGRMTMLVAALEPRIRIAVVSGALNVMQERISGPYSCGAQIIPGLLRHGDVPEIASLIAPRPSIWEVGSQDRLIPPRWAQAAVVRMARAYRALGAEEQLVIDRFEGRHQWHGTVAYPLLERYLK